MTNATGAVLWSAAYTPFGKAEVAISTQTNNFRFPGQYYDQETGLHYNWHRYYDPKTGRYLTADPIGLEGGINLYTYVKNQPVKLTDSLGLWGEDPNWWLPPQDGWLPPQNGWGFIFPSNAVIYGSYCGPGAKKDPETEPGDDCVDEACRMHDLCYGKANIKWLYPQLYPGTMRCDRILCKDTNASPTTCNNFGIKSVINTVFRCSLITPFGL